MLPAGNEAELRQSERHRHGFGKNGARTKEYRAKTASILSFYETKGLLRRVDGMSSVDEVAAQIDAILDN